MTETRIAVPGWLARPALLLFGALLLSACTSVPQVRTSGAADVDIAAFRTFGFIDNPSTDRAGYQTLISQQLAFSTRRELEVRGLQFVADSAAADLLINFYIDLTDRFRVRNTGPAWRGPSYWHYRYGLYGPWRGHRHWPTHSAMDVEQVTQGTLSVDVVDARNNTLVWEGVATRRVTQQTLNDLGPALDDAVHRIFAEFPIAPTL